APCGSGGACAARRNRGPLRPEGRRRLPRRVVTALPIGLQRRYRHLRRYRRIAEVLLRHGFGYIVESMELQHLVPLRRRIQGEEPEHRPRGARLRAALEELGPTFIKLGQMLSARPDLLPADVVAELARLQDR